MLVLHANWTDGALHVWGESLDAFLSSGRFAHAAETSAPRPVNGGGMTTAVSAAASVAAPAAPGIKHSFACSAEQIRQAIAGLIGELQPAGKSIRLRLPSDELGPWPSQRLARRVGEIEMPFDPALREFELESLAIPNQQILPILRKIDARRRDRDLDLDASVQFWIAVGDFITELLINQRFVPALMQMRGNGMRAAWQPWLSDDDARQRITALMRAMPPAVRAVVDQNEGRPWAILEDAVRSIADAFIRSVLHDEQFIEAIEDRDPAKDAHVAWLTGLLDRSDQVKAAPDGGLFLLRDASAWINQLDEKSKDRPLRLCFKLTEPAAAAGPQDKTSDPQWPLSLHLQSPDDPDHLIDAAAVWGHAVQDGSRAANLRSDSQPQEILLAELGRASRVYPKIEVALSEQHPTTVQLTTHEAYEFLREFKPLLEESGFAVIVPAWWDQPIGRLAARLHIDAPAASEIAPGGAAGMAPAASVMGLNSLVKFNWQIAIGDQAISLEELHALTNQDAPLVQVRGRWIEISPEQLAQAREFLEKTPAGEMTLLEAIHIAHGSAGRQFGLPVLGMDATGWVSDLLNASSDDHRMPMLEQPDNFHGTLRPYQKTGLSWLAFLDRFGLGACLADDMGLGKTIQLIALLLQERNMVRDAAAPPLPPTLLVVPTSVVANWVRELQRFAPSVKALVHHGPERTLGDQFVPAALKHDLVITTYPLISRDVETLKRVQWHRVALDEAQFIKNPPTKQTTAIRSLHAPRRLALTGTPVENRLSELWSIMEFCNPGYLGPSGEFRRRFAVPIERHHNRLQADRLRQMVRPFVLRRVKTDPNVIDDLPDCTETKEYATLTVEQATMYQQAVNAMLGQVDRASGIQRRGLVLATLVKLKQICNHPAQAGGAHSEQAELSETESAAPQALPSTTIAPSPEALSARSGKAKRLMVMLEEVIASGEKALIFTQFRQMGHLLTAMIQHDLDCEALFLHGGTPAAKRQHLIDRFQSNDGGVPIFVLSLKAGGLGLNLTAANHVFHYDRWWNPAVENQATDRAFRIGQMRAVQVHKFVCLGTLEERIDQMIEQKTELAQNIIGAGEQWLTELSTNQLHDLLMLRPSAMEGES